MLRHCGEGVLGDGVNDRDHGKAHNKTHHKGVALHERVHVKPAGIKPEHGQEA